MACSPRPPLPIWMGSYIALPYLEVLYRWSFVFLESGTPEKRPADRAGAGGLVRLEGVKDPPPPEGVPVRAV